MTTGHAEGGRGGGVVRRRPRAGTSGPGRHRRPHQHDGAKEQDRHHSTGQRGPPPRGVGTSRGQGRGARAGGTGLGASQRSAHLRRVSDVEPGRQDRQAVRVVPKTYTAVKGEGRVVADLSVDRDLVRAGSPKPMEPVQQQRLADAPSPGWRATRPGAGRTPGSPRSRRWRNRPRPAGHRGRPGDGAGGWPSPLLAARHGQDAKKERRRLRRPSTSRPGARGRRGGRRGTAGTGGSSALRGRSSR